MTVSPRKRMAVVGTRSLRGGKVTVNEEDCFSIKLSPTTSSRGGAIKKRVSPKAKVRRQSNILKRIELPDEGSKLSPILTRRTRRKSMASVITQKMDVTETTKMSRSISDKVLPVSRKPRSKASPKTSIKPPTTKPLPPKVPTSKTSAVKNPPRKYGSPTAPKETSPKSIKKIEVSTKVTVKSANTRRITKTVSKTEKKAATPELPKAREIRLKRNNNYIQTRKSVTPTAPKDISPKNIKKTEGSAKVTVKSANTRRITKTVLKTEKKAASPEVIKAKDVTFSPVKFYSSPKKNATPPRRKSFIIGVDKDVSFNYSPVANNKRKFDGPPTPEAGSEAKSKKCKIDKSSAKKSKLSKPGNKDKVSEDTPKSTKSPKVTRTKAVVKTPKEESSAKSPKQSPKSAKKQEAILSKTDENSPEIKKTTTKSPNKKSPDTKTQAPKSDEKSAEIKKPTTKTPNKKSPDTKTQAPKSVEKSAEIKKPTTKTPNKKSPDTKAPTPKSDKKKSLKNTPEVRMSIKSSAKKPTPTGRKSIKSSAKKPTPSPSVGRPKKVLSATKTTKKVKISANSPEGATIEYRKTPKSDKHKATEAVSDFGASPELKPAVQLLAIIRSSPIKSKTKLKPYTPKPDPTPSRVLKQTMKRKAAKDMQLLKMAAKRMDTSSLVDSDLVIMKTPVQLTRIPLRKTPPVTPETPSSASNLPQTPTSSRKTLSIKRSRSVARRELLNRPSTPLIGRSTPLIGRSTPLNGPSTPLNGPSTPLNGPSTPLNGPSTPLNGPSTPLNGPLTPLNGPSPPRSSTPIEGDSSPEPQIADPDVTDINDEIVVIKEISAEITTTEIVTTEVTSNSMSFDEDDNGVATSIDSEDDVSKSFDINGSALATISQENDPPSKSNWRYCTVM